jgi:hypothetical protein
MPNQRLFAYPISLERMDGFLDRQIVKRAFYVHRINLISRLNPKEMRINSVVHEVGNSLPKGLSDEGAKEYFSREMRKKGFREIEFPRATGVNAGYFYPCVFKD